MSDTIEKETHIEKRGYRSTSPEDNPLMAYNARLTPEERRTQAQIAGKKSGEVRSARAAARRTLVTASNDFLDAHADELIQRVGEIALSSKSEKMILTAVNDLSNYSGQRSATKEQVQVTHSIEGLDLRSLSDDELLKLSAEYEVVIDADE